MVRSLFWLLDLFGQIGAAFGLALMIGKQSPTAYAAADLTQKYGINSVELMLGLQYLRDLYKKGVIGPGKEIDCNLPFDQIGSMNFANKITRMIANRKSPQKVDIDKTPIVTALSKIQPLEIRQVRRTPFEKLFNSLIAQHHYLGYCHPVGEHLKYIAFANRRPIACLAWCSAPWYIGARDRFIGWTPQIRQENLHLMVTNTRFLILP